MTLDRFVDFLCAAGKHYDGQRVEMDVPARALKMIKAILDTNILIYISNTRWMTTS
jgi:hypothetical protein